MLHTEYSVTADTLCVTAAAALPCPFREARALTLAAALCARNAIGGPARIQWPCDIMLTDTVVCRAEVHGQADAADFRFTVDRAALAAHGIAVEPGALAERITAALDEVIAGCPDGLPELIQRYCAHCLTLMKFVDVTYRGMPVYGFAFAVDKHGGLMVMTQSSRTVITVYSGPAKLAAAEPEAPEMPAMPRA